MSRTPPRHGVGGIFVDGDVLMRDDITTTAKLVYGYACKYVVTDDRQRDGGLEVGQVWLRTRQRDTERPGVDRALGISHGASERAIESLIDLGLLAIAYRPTMAERRAGKSTVYWVVAFAPAAAVATATDVAQVHSPRNGDSHMPQNGDSHSPRNEVRDSPQNGGCDSPRNGGCLYEGSVVRMDAVAAAASAATVEGTTEPLQNWPSVDAIVATINEVSGGSWTVHVLRARIEAAIAAHPELTLTDHQRIIRQQAAAPWRKAGPLTPNHVYRDLEQFERCIADAATTPAASPAAAPDDGLTRAERDAIQAYRNTGVDAHLGEIDAIGSPTARVAAAAARAARQVVAA